MKRDVLLEHRVFVHMFPLQVVTQTAAASRRTQRHHTEQLPGWTTVVHYYWKS